MFHEQLDYTIQLAVFEGPLDLLLKLIEREELDITAIALAQVADQYLAYVRALQTPDPAALSAFLVIAAKLLLIKSRALLPRPSPPRDPDAPLDEGAELAQQLREYQRYKQAATLLRSWADQGRRAYVRAAPPPLPVAAADEKLDVTLNQMIAAVQRRMQLLLPLDAPTVPLPAPKIVTVPEAIARVQGRLRVQAWFGFEDLLSLTVQRVEVVVTLWAVLELLKRRAIVVDQAELFGSIMIGRGPDFDVEHSADSADGTPANGSAG
jgi:segregation and condensation protein A